MALVVKKFGGSSVASTDKILNVANRVLNDKRPDDQVVVVVSAMGDTTDDLISLAQGIDDQPYKSSYSREMDMLLTTGEQVSIALLAMAFQKLGQPAISLTGSQIGMHTSSNHTKGRILSIDPARVIHELDKGKIVVAAGFQGIDKHGDPVTLGRGGSDTSAVALAGALKADSCEIFTDVDGIYSADPRIVKGARKMREITYYEMLEMARLGAGVMQPSTFRSMSDQLSPIRPAPSSGRITPWRSKVSSFAASLTTRRSLSSPSSASPISPASLIRSSPRSPTPTSTSI